MKSLLRKKPVITPVKFPSLQMNSKGQMPFIIGGQTIWAKTHAAAKRKFKE